jgi:hypothetical protein
MIDDSAAPAQTQSGYGATTSNDNPLAMLSEDQWPFYLLLIGILFSPVWLVNWWVNRRHPDPVMAKWATYSLYAFILVWVLFFGLFAFFFFVGIFFALLSTLLAVI